MLKYSGGRTSARAGTGIAPENYGRLRESNNSLIRGRVHVAHAPLDRTRRLSRSSTLLRTL